MGVNGSHYVGCHHILFEGNWGDNCDDDETHGNVVYHTFFRNDCTAIRSNFNDPSGRLSFEVALKAGQAWHRCLIYDLADGAKRFLGPRKCTHLSATSDHAGKMYEWQRAVLKISTSNEEFYRCYDQGIQDMAALRLPLKAPITWCSWPGDLPETVL
jgi:hypothetical protein